MPKRGNPKIAEVAHLGGIALSRDRKHMAALGRKGGASVSQDREHMAKIGRKGGLKNRRIFGSDERTRVAEMRKSGLGWTEIAAEIGVSRATILRAFEGLDRTEEAHA